MTVWVLMSSDVQYSVIVSQVCLSLRKFKSIFQSYYEIVSPGVSYGLKKSRTFVNDEFQFQFSSPNKNSTALQ